MAATLAGLATRYDFGDSHPLLGRRMPDLDLATTSGPLRVYATLHDGKPVLLTLGITDLDIAQWADRVTRIDATYTGAWELPDTGPVSAPTAVLIRPDGYVAWVGDGSAAGLAEAMTKWFGPTRT
jgi:3-(3-hydroxy-phenyl)propionate hydroxylase